MHPLNALYYGYTKGYSGYKDQCIKEDRQKLHELELEIKTLKVTKNLQLKTLELELKAIREQRLSSK